MMSHSRRRGPARSTPLHADGTFRVAAQSTMTPPQHRRRGRRTGKLPSMSPKKAPETPKHEPSEMEQAIMKRQQQSEVAQISQRINAVLEDYEKSTPEPARHRAAFGMPDPGFDESPATPAEFKATTVAMKEEVAGLLAQVENRTKNRMVALGAVKASLQSLGNPDAVTQQYLDSIKAGGSGGGRMMARGGPGNDTAHALRAGAASNTVSWDIDTHGFDEALAVVSDGRGKLTSNYDTLVALFKKNGLTGTAALRELRDKVTALARELDTAQEALRLRDLKVGRLTERTKNLSAEASQLSMQVNRLMREATEANVQREEAERARKVAEDRLAKAQADATAALAVSNRAEQEAARMARRLKLSDKANKDLSEKLALTKKQVKEMQSQLLFARGVSKKDAGAADGPSLVEEMQAMRERVAGIDAEVRDGVDKALAEAAMRHAKELADAKAQARSQAYEKELRLMQEQEDMEGRLADLKKRLKASEAALSASEKDRQSLEGQLMDVKVSLKEMEHRAVVAEQAAPASAAGHRRPAPQRSKAKIEELATAATSGEATAALLDAIMGDLLTQASHERVTSDLDCAALTAEVSRLKGLIADTNQENFAGKQSKASLAASIARLEGELEQSRADKAELLEAETQLKAKIAKLQFHLGSALTGKDNAEKDCERWQLKFAVLEGGLDAGDSDAIKAANAELLRLQEELRQSKEALHQARVEAGDQQARAAAMAVSLRREGLETPETKTRREGNAAADLYGDMRDVGCNTEDNRVSSGSQTRMTGDHLAAMQKKIEESQDDGTVTGALAKWSKAKLAEEYQKLRRIAWDIRNENARLLSANKAFKLRLEELEPAYTRLKRSTEANAVIAEALAGVKGGRRQDVMRALASVRASVEHRLHEVRSAAQAAVGQLQNELEHERQAASTNRMRGKVKAMIQANRFVNMFKGGSGSPAGGLLAAMAAAKKAKQSEGAMDGDAGERASPVGAASTGRAGPSSARGFQALDRELEDVTDEVIKTETPNLSTGGTAGQGLEGTQQSPSRWRQAFMSKRSAADLAAGDSASPQSMGGGQTPQSQQHHRQRHQSRHPHQLSGTPAPILEGAEPPPEPQASAGASGGGATSAGPRHHARHRGSEPPRLMHTPIQEGQESQQAPQQGRDGTRGAAGPASHPHDVGVGTDPVRSVSHGDQTVPQASAGNGGQRHGEAGAHGAATAPHEALRGEDGGVVVTPHARRELYGTEGSVETMPHASRGPHTGAVTVASAAGHAGGQQGPGQAQSQGSAWGTAQQLLPAGSGSTVASTRDSGRGASDGAPGSGPASAGGNATGGTVALGGSGATGASERGGLPPAPQAAGVRSPAHGHPPQPPHVPHASGTGSHQQHQQQHRAQQPPQGHAGQQKYYHEDYSAMLQTPGPSGGGGATPSAHGSAPPSGSGQHAGAPSQHRQRLHAGMHADPREPQAHASHVRPNERRNSDLSAVSSVSGTVAGAGAIGFAKALDQFRRPKVKTTESPVHVGTAPGARGGAGGGGGGGSMRGGGGGGGGGRGSVAQESSVWSATGPAGVKGQRTSRSHIDTASTQYQQEFGHRHEGDRAWLNVGMGSFDPWADLTHTRDQLAQAGAENERLQEHVRELRGQLKSMQQEGEAWKTAATRLDAHAKSLDQENKLMDQLENEKEFTDAVHVLTKRVSELQRTLERGHVDFSYMSKFVEDVKARSVRTLSRIKSRVSRRRQTRVHLPGQRTATRDRLQQQHPRDAASDAGGQRRRVRDDARSVGSGTPMSARGTNAGNAGRQRRRGGRAGKRNSAAARGSHRGLAVDGSVAGGSMAASSVGGSTARSHSSAHPRFDPIDVAADPGPSPSAARAKLRQELGLVGGFVVTPKPKPAPQQQQPQQLPPRPEDRGAGDGKNAVFRQPQASESPSRVSGGTVAPPPVDSARGARDEDSFLPLLSPAHGSFRSGSKRGRGRGLAASASEPALPAVAAKEQSTAAASMRRVGSSSGVLAVPRQYGIYTPASASVGPGGGVQAGSRDAKHPQLPRGTDAQSSWKALPVSSGPAGSGVRAGSPAVQPEANADNTPRSMGPWPSSRSARSGRSPVGPAVSAGGPPVYDAAPSRPTRRELAQLGVS